jgi:hypothetical protein
MAGQRHDLRRRKWEASADARRDAEKRRAHRRKLARRKKLRAARQVDPAEISAWREAKRKSGS